MLLLWVGWTLAEVVVVGGNQKVTIGVGLRGEGFGRSVERGPLLDLLLLGLCVLCVVLGLPLPFAEGLVQGLSRGILFRRRCFLVFLSGNGGRRKLPLGSSLVFCYGSTW